ncbi:MAG: aminotransferase class I/II-fold pyridoxal phosphate-dependent enzyme [Gemmatimonadaceae bacterium]|jgi:dTDP-4-amino-4,6-dideoxygalactose transaminase|nr:aminotransferase class I/II-fold pyridoxal phosphate-dependent enzyme [Gemmatimonadaceae bacterium]MCC6430662.1 aminotransferase class I/II-fold pyridoxal phosphate-dependent enzyme [Gemmatimonadaceae bacterium]
MTARIYLSPPHLGETELAMVAEAFRTNWIAPLGPHVDAFEREFSAYVDTPHAVALSSGTAALHLALLALGIGDGDTVWVSTLTFAASAFPIRYVGATPVFVDSDHATWNMDPALLAQALDEAAMRETLPRAVVVVHLYGQCADIEPIADACARHGVLLIEDAAEALGAQYKGRAAGTFGDVGFFSFNGNKIITTSGGGMLVTPHADVAARVRSLATQAREPVPHYEHTRIGYNYRLSNVLAGIGRGQLQVLESRVAARRAVFDRYASDLADIPGIMLMPEATFGSPDSRANRWLTVLTVDPHHARLDAERLRLALEAEEIESRPVWKPMHQQPVFRRSDCIGGSVADALFATGLCLPSGSSLMRHEQDRVIGVIRRECEAARARGKRYSSAAA